ncbi:MAG: FtsX-like permease family protein [Imperialibacter sp.]|uniref:FtsX-like permease family protein n=1 Tax=Imperialibacter sp. TaxID=2038411 RepID=UPI0032ED4E7D
MKKRPHIPPPLAERLLQRALRSDLAEEVLGDLEEKFYATVEKKSARRAKLNYWYQAMNYLRPFAIRKSRLKNSNYTAMFQHNLTLTFRNFQKHKSQFLINLAGLSTGLTCVLFIYLWVTDEVSTDHFHKKGDRLYQIMSNHTDASGVSTWKGVPGLLLEEIQATIPEAESTTAFTDPHEYTLSVGDVYFKANGRFASQDFFDVFSYQLAEGNGKTALADKSGILISRSLAQRVFKTTDAIGRQIVWHSWGNTKTVQVAGILEDIPSSSSEKFDFIMSWNYFHDDLVSYKQWNNYYGRIALVLASGTEQDEVAAKIDAILKEKLEGDRVSIFLAKYDDKYLYSEYENGVQAGGRIEYVHLFSMVALFVLLIACINFINLSTAKASHRLKEIGVKKSLGASRQSLMGQYFTESFFLIFLSMMVAFSLVWLFLPQFNSISQKDLVLKPDGQLIVAAIGLVVMVGLLAGSYPALYLSGLKSVEVLKGKLSRKAGEVWSRKALVVVQFSLSIILIVAVVVVYQQMEFVKDKNLGFNREDIIYFEREGKFIENSEAFVNELKTLPGVTGAAVSGFMLGGANSTGGVDWPGKTPEDQLQFWETNVGFGTIEMLGIEMVEGHAFSEKFGADSTGVIFNETAIAAMGIKNPISQTITHYTGDKKIIGVVKDFNMLSLHKTVEPMMFLLEPAKTHFVMARLKSGNEEETIKGIQTLYESFNPGYQFIPLFLDQDYQALYASEERVAILSRYFAGIAILISCLGLFGLSSFMTEKRIKEIGIRKVLGSSVIRVVYLLTADFTKMVLAATVIALPVSYIMARKWLENFAYGIDLTWWHFVFAGLAALLVAWLTVGLQTFRAARINPAKCLRSE